MALILAVEPDTRQAAALSSALRGRARADVVLAETAEAAVHAVGVRVPDLLLTSPLLSPQDEDALAAWLRGLGPVGSHVHQLTIPSLAAAAEPEAPRRFFDALRRRRPQASAPDSCDPLAFAERIAQYLEQAVSARPHTMIVPAPARAAARVSSPASQPAPASGQTLITVHVEGDPLDDNLAPDEITIAPGYAEIGVGFGVPLPSAEAASDFTSTTNVESASSGKGSIRERASETDTDPGNEDSHGSADMTWEIVPLTDVTEVSWLRTPERIVLAEEPLWMLTPPPETLEPDAPELEEMPEAGPHVLLLEPVYELLTESAVPVVTTRITATGIVLPSEVVTLPAGVTPLPEPPALHAAEPPGRPPQDEWGLFDPEQCGFSALLDRLDETPNVEKAASRDKVSVRIISY